MRKSGSAECVLRVVAGRERGAVIYGDLVELTATRGRAWFWMAYVRTMVALTWRTAAALLAGVAFFQLLDLATRGDAGLTLWVTSMVSPTLANIAIALLIIVPYVTVRYGLRDRMVHSGWVVLVLGTVAGLLSSYVTLAILAATLIAALSVRAWRRPFAVLTLVVGVGAAMAACFPATASWNVVAMVTVPIMGLVCARLRRSQLTTAA